MKTPGPAPVPPVPQRPAAPSPLRGPVAPPVASATDEYVPTMVVLGDSLSAGTQDASTVGGRQEMAYASQLARAAGVPFQNPRISEPGLPFRVFGGGAVDEGNMDRVRGLLEASLAWNMLQIGPGGRPLLLVGDHWSELLELLRRRFVVSDADLALLRLLPGEPAPEAIVAAAREALAAPRSDAAGWR